MTEELTTLIALTRDPEATSAALTDALEQARAMASSAETARRDAETAYLENLLSLSDVAIAKLLTKRDTDAIRCDQAQALVSALELRRGKAVSAEAEVARREAYARAEAGRNAAAEALATRYPALVAELLDLLHLVASADADVVVANADLPAGAARLAGAEDLARNVTGLPREIVDETMVDLFCFEGSDQPLAPEFQSRVVCPEADKRFGYLSSPPPRPDGRFTSGGKVHVVSQRFRRISYRAAVPAQQPPKRLAEALRLPALQADDAKGWHFEREAWDFEPVKPSTVLARLEQIARAAALPVEVARRPIEVEYTRIPLRSLPNGRPEAGMGFAQL